MYEAKGAKRGKTGKRAGRGKGAGGRGTRQKEKVIRIPRKLCCAADLMLSQLAAGYVTFDITES